MTDGEAPQSQNPGGSQEQESRPNRRSRRPRGRGKNKAANSTPDQEGSEQVSQGHTQPEAQTQAQSQHQPQTGHHPQAQPQGRDQGEPSNSASAKKGKKKQGPPPRPGNQGTSSSNPRATAGPSTRRTFGGHLTTQEDGDEEASEASHAPSLYGDAPEFVPGQALPVRSKPKAKPKAKPAVKEKLPRSTAVDLGTRIHEDISNGNYECIICTEDVLRNSKVYSCPKCYTVLHLKCVRAWYKPQVEKKEQDVTGSAEPDGSWRCPGCNSNVQDVPSYHCWCGKEDQPKPASKALPPHSCGQTCSKPRPTCPHPCSLQCHAGPCPPCEAMGPTQACFCGKHEVRKPCRETDYQNGWSCLEPCGDLLPCGNHVCTEPCHPGLCGQCELLIDAKCYCGRVQKQLFCYKQGDIQQSYSAADHSWFEASFPCDQVCSRNFDCGIHKCLQSCHAQDELPSHCPFAPDVVSHCPCSKTPLEELMQQPRQNCEESIPHCQKACNKRLSCGHLCKANCHEGECPSCNEHIQISCRCGRVSTESLCHMGDLQPPQCLRTCQANLNCGRHKCGEHCCMGEKKATERLAAQRKKKGPVPAFEAEHICIKTCGKLLKCGKHNCEQMCHRGLCGSCPEAIFEEISCNCGKTVLQPPQPCGTRPPECRFQCPKIPSCGHPRVDHHCHPDDVECPKCPFLVDKLCVCGKETISFHPCHLQEAHCGKTCGKKLACGHTCRKLCHKPGECSGETSPSKTCGQVCVKPKLLCEHPCQSYCHGQTPCNESLPCAAKLTITCPCGQRKKEVKCLASNSNPSPSHPRIECDDECLRLERNRRLADALNIDPASQLTDHIPYSETTLKLFKELGAWAEDKEREFRVFTQSKDEIRMRFPPMPSGKRQFLHVLAEDYRLESFSEDREPHRHVVVNKQTFAKDLLPPSKTLGQCIKIRQRQAAEQQAAKVAQLNNDSPLERVEPFNALLLTSPAFGLTIEDLHSALDPILSTRSFTMFSIDFLPSDEVLIRVTAGYSASLGPEGVLTTLRDQISAIVKEKDLAGGVIMAAANNQNEVLRRERSSRHDPAGWNAVAGRAAKKEGVPVEEPAAATKSSGRRMLGLKKRTPAAAASSSAERGSEKAWGVLDDNVPC